MRLLKLPRLLRSPPFSRRNLLALGVAGLAAEMARATQRIQTWPTQPVRLLMGFPGGSTPDMAAGVLGDVLAPPWGQPVVVD